MEIRHSIIESLEKQGVILTGKPEVIDALERIYNDINEGNSLKYAPIDIGKSIFGDASVIPSNKKLKCSKALLTFCYDDDNLEQRIYESLNYISLKCKKVCNEIYFLTTHWDSSIGNKLSGYIESVRQNGVSIYFIYVTEKGFAIMPV